MEEKTEDYQAEEEILELAKLRIYQKVRGLTPVLGAAVFRIVEKGAGEENEPAGFCTDGRTFYFEKKSLREEFLKGSDFLYLKILHMLSHCLLGHPFRVCRGRERIQRDERCDREAWELTERLWGNTGGVLEEAQNAAKEGDKEKVRRLLFADSHEEWGRAAEREAAWWQGQGEKLLKKGSPAGKRRQGGAMEFRRRRLVPAAGQRGDYRAILRSFSAWREDMGLSSDEFQYSWYAYGLELYGNLPLVEPLEYREDRKISELVIVIDTSGSCEKELVRVFLEETRGILEQERLFFSRFCLHILQCDNRLQRDDCIRTREELETYLEELEIRGGGGTDFRPAFEQIEQLRKKGELKDLRGVLYFTDGCGRYPAQEPDYEVWFVMLKGHFDTMDMPGWCRRLILEERR